MPKLLQSYYAYFICVSKYLTKTHGSTLYGLRPIGRCWVFDKMIYLYPISFIEKAG